MAVVTMILVMAAIALLVDLWTAHVQHLPVKLYHVVWAGVLVVILTLRVIQRMLDGSL